MKKIIALSIKHRWLVLLGVILISCLGVYNFTKLPIDAVPDITNVQVQINTSAKGYSPLEVEQRITYPIETAMAGLPKLDYTRSLSRYGISQVTVIFKDKTDIYFARQLISQRLNEAKENLPPNIEPAMGPVSTGLGEIYMYSVEAQKDAVNKNGKPYSLQDLRTIQDWVIRPQLRNINSVNEVNTIGGFEKQYHITPYPQKLISYGIALHDIVEAIYKNNQNVGAGYIEKNGEQYLARVPGQVKTIKEIGEITIKIINNIPIYIKDVADIIEGKELRTGAASMNGKETVIGTTMMLIGENSRIVSKNVDKKIKQINETLPEGVNVKTLYNRTNLVNATIKTVKNNLLEGALLVIVVLFLLLGNFRAAFITALIIPISMLITVTGMVKNNVSGNLMSLGALDFGLIVDGSVIIVENCIRRLAEEQKKLGRLLTLKERLKSVLESSIEVRRATMFGELIIIMVYIPIFTLQGIEGKLFHPMAFTVIFALLGAMLLSVTFIPAAVAIFLKGKIKEKENFLIVLAKKLYLPLLKISLNNKSFVVALALAIIFLSSIIATRIGSEFIPQLDEGDFAMHAMRIPSTSISQSVKMQLEVEKLLQKIPEVKLVFSKIGTAEVATDPMPPSVADTFIILKDKSQWSDARQTKEDILKKIKSQMKKLIGNNYEYTQPIQMRFNELISGIRSDLGVKIYGDDNQILLKTAQKVEKIINKIYGANDVKTEQITGLPVITVVLDRNLISRYGISIQEAQEAVQIALGGKEVGKIYQGDKRFKIVVRLPDKIRQNVESLKRLPILLNNNNSDFVLLGSVAKIQISEGINQISRENGKRRIIVTANIKNRDLGSFVTEVKNKINEAKIIPPEYWIDYGGQFKQLISASKRLSIVIPVVLSIIFILLYMSLGNIKDSIIVFTGVPLALTGGITAIWFREIPFSISAGVGFIALSGVAVLNGLVMITFINKLNQNNINLKNAIIEGCLLRLRPVLMTALVASLGFIPMALSTGIGAEVQKPLATVVIGGIISSTLLTLFVLPTLYAIFHKSVKT